MISTIHFQIAGGLLLALAVCHSWFPRRFGWRAEAATMSLLNRQIFYVHAFFIALGLLLNGLLFVACPNLLLRSDPLARFLLGSIGAFWTVRLFVQLFIYDRRLWVGDASRTAIHVLFTFFWAYLGGICLLAMW